MNSAAYVEFPVNEDVSWLQVAMRDTQLVHRRHPRGNLLEDISRRAFRKLAGLHNEVPQTVATATSMLPRIAMQLLDLEQCVLVELR